MNKRARMRLIVVTAIILLGVGGLLAYTYFSDSASPAYYKTVAEVSKDSSLVGQRVRVAGAVVPGSWDKKTDPMRFTIKAEGDDSSNGPVIKVVYQGTTPSTFGDGVVAIVTGDLQADNTIQSNDMITKCPSKYESAQGAETLDMIVGNSARVGKPTRVTAYVVPGSIKAVGQGDRFVVSTQKGGQGKTVGVAYEAALPSGMTDDSQVVMLGAIEQDGTFVATDVSLEQSQK